MPPQIAEWSNLILRWVHVLSAMAWVGSTYSLVKLTRLLVPGGEPQAGQDGTSPAWLVQGGDVYIAEPRRGQPLLPARRFVLL